MLLWLFLKTISWTQTATFFQTSIENQLSTNIEQSPLLLFNQIIIASSITSASDDIDWSNILYSDNLKDLIKYLLTTRKGLLDSPTWTHTCTTQTLCKQLEGYVGWLLALAYLLESRYTAHTITSRGTRILLVHWDSAKNFGLNQGALLALYWVVKDGLTKVGIAELSLPLDCTS